MNDLQGAEKDFTRSIALNPAYPDSYKNRGNLYFKLNRLSEACADWKKSAEMGKAVAQYCK